MSLPNYIGSGNLQSMQQAQQTQQAQQASQQAASQQAALQKYGSETISALNSGDYTDAWKDALASESAYGGSQSVGSAPTDPLVAALESSQGLHAIDPSLTMNSSQIDQYYNAFAQTTGTNAHGASGTGFNGNLVGQNPYGLWGTAADTTAGVDAAAQKNAQLSPGLANVSDYLGARPDNSFLSKYGTDIAALALTAVSFGVAAPALAGALAADGVATGLAAGAIAGGVVGGLDTVATDAITGKPITAGGVLGGALGGAAGGGLQSLASGAINQATGLGNTISGGLAGAGIGATRSALTGGNVGLGALTGGIGGAVQGSGVAGQAAQGLSNTTGLSSGAANALVNGATGAAVGGVTGAAASALMGNTSGANTSGATTPVSPQTLSQGAGAPNASGNAGSTALNGGALLGAGVGGALLGAGVGGNAGYNSSGAAGNGASIGNIGLGNNGSMGNLDTSLSSTLTSALPSVLQGAAGVYGSQNAAEAQTQAEQAAIGTQQSTLGTINNIWSTQQGVGQGADSALGSALGTNGQPANYSGFENMPGYQFAVQQGTQAIQRQAASMGSAYTPNTAAAVGQYVTGTAMGDYNTYISQLMGAAGLGTTANQGLQTGNQSVGNNISQLQQNQGQAQASGVLGASNAVGGAFGQNGSGTSLIGAASKYLSGGAGGGNGVTGAGGNSSNPYASLIGGGTATMANGGSSGNYNFNGSNSGAPDMSNGGAFTGSGIDPNAPMQAVGQYNPTLPTVNTGDSSGSILDSLNSSNFGDSYGSGMSSYFNMAGTS